MSILLTSDTSMLGSADFKVVWSGATVFQDTVLFPADASALIVVNSDGTVSGSASASWYEDSPEAGIGNNYEVRATLSSGDIVNIGVMNTWLPLSSNRTWNNVRSGIGERTSNILLQYRNALTQVVVMSKTIILSAIVLDA